MRLLRYRLNSELPEAVRFTRTAPGRPKVLMITLPDALRMTRYEGLTSPRAAFLLITRTLTDLPAFVVHDLASNTVLPRPFTLAGHGEQPTGV